MEFRKASRRERHHKKTHSKKAKTNMNHQNKKWGENRYWKGQRQKAIRRARTMKYYNAPPLLIMESKSDKAWKAHIRLLIKERCNTPEPQQDEDSTEAWDAHIRLLINERFNKFFTCRVIQ